jgi:hypothetical protein
MNLTIRPAPTPDREQLRALLIDAADQLLGEGSTVLEARLHTDAEPILLADAALHPVLISFDPKDSESALLYGLRAMESLSKALPWVNQTYAPLQQRQLPPKLVVVSQTFPPGASITLCTCSGLSLFQYRLLQVNDQAGLWLSPLDARPAEVATPGTAPGDLAAASLEQASNDLLPELSEEEQAYFEQF